MNRTHHRAGAAAIRALLLGALVLGAVACAARTPEAGAPGADAGGAAGAEDGGQRTARLVASQSPPIGGTASISPATGGGLFAQIRLQGSPAANVAHPWRIFAGTCGVRGGTLLGSGVDYPIVQMQADGTGESQARLERVRMGGIMNVRVYASSSNSTVIACGDFR